MTMARKAAAMVVLGVMGSMSAPGHAKAQAFAPIDPNVSAKLTAADFGQKIDNCLKAAMASGISGRDTSAQQGNIRCGFDVDNNRYSFKVQVISDAGLKAAQFSTGLGNIDGRVTLVKPADSQMIFATTTTLDSGKVRYQVLDTDSRNIAPAVAAFNSMIAKFKTGQLTPDHALR